MTSDNGIYAEKLVATRTTTITGAQSLVNLVEMFLESMNLQKSSTRTN